MDEIKLEDYWTKKFPNGHLPSYAKEMMLEFASDILQLATENASIKTEVCMGVVIDHNIDRDSILNTINQIE